MLSATKNIIAELNKSVKLNGDNYEIWSIKIQYVLKEQEALEALNLVMPVPKDGTSKQHVKNRKTYNAWKKKNLLTRITLLSNMDDDVMRKFHKHANAKDMWSTLNEKFKKTFLARLKALTIKFDIYKKCHDRSMRKHLRHMSNMINELKDANHELTNKQQVQVVIHSLSQNWEYLKIYLIHNVHIQDREDVI